MSGYDFEHIILDVYGDGSMPRALARHINNVLQDHEGEDDLERTVMLECWEWFPGGDTAVLAARRVMAALEGWSAV